MFRTGNGADAYVYRDDALPAGTTDYALFGIGILRVNLGGASRMFTLLRTSGGLNYNVIATDGAGTGILLDANGGATSAITVGLNTPFFWCAKVNGTGAGGAALYVRFLNSTTVTKVTATSGASFTVEKFVLGDSSFSERFDGELGGLILYGGAGSGAFTDGQVASQLGEISSFSLLAYCFSNPCHRSFRSIR